MKPLDKKHSPEPWEVIDYYYKTYVKSESEIVAQLPGCGGKFRANADLISAAPELLDALKEATLEHCKQYAPIEDEYCFYLDKEKFKCIRKKQDCCAQRWLAAIRKAEGIK